MNAGFFAAAVVTGATLVAQQAAPAPDLQSRRDNVHMMEGVLTQAVRRGAEQLGLRMQSVDPTLVLLTGSARARGFMLDGYGVFFDVEIPAVRQSVAWSVRTMEHDREAGAAIRQLRQYVNGLPDAAARAQLDQELRRIELLTPQARAPQPATPGSVVAATADGPDTGTFDPNQQYTEVVKAALVDAMLDYSGPMHLQPNEWLTVAARDSEGSLAPGELSDLATIVLRVKGSDLAAFHANQLSRDDVRKRVEVQEF
ncbi:MAG TPA: hypothetical protein VFX12_03425 [Vicinamibacterales bacterium]|nr:hypothetical protein [Vicinamibacterales bacterium]